MLIPTYSGVGNFIVGSDLVEVSDRQNPKCALLYEVSLEQIICLQSSCASFESITAIEITWKWVKEGEGNPFAETEETWTGNCKDSAKKFSLKSLHFRTWSCRSRVRLRDGTAQVSRKLPETHFRFKTKASELESRVSAFYQQNGIKVDFSKISWEDIIQKLNKKTWEKVVPYPRFISLLLEYMMPEYDHKYLTINPTQVFNVLNWALKPNQPERTPFTDHMLAICNTDVHVENKAPKTSLPAEKKVSYSKKLRPRTSTPVVAEIYKEAQQETRDPTSLGATSEEGINPQLNSDMSASKNNESIFFASTTFHSESTSGCDASADSTAEADPGFSALNDSMPQQQGIDEGTKNYTTNHMFGGTNLSVLVDQTKSVRDGLKTAHTNSDTRDSFHTNPEDTSAPHPSSLKSVQLQELKDQETDIQEKDDKASKKKHTKPSTGWKRQSQIEAKVSQSQKVRKSTQTKSKVNQVKKIQLKGLKLPNLKLYYKNKKTRAEI
ncbi:hypothetical protein Tco_1035341, partial [Tanacetum coccineum]